MNIPIYLSHATPHTLSHQRFLDRFRSVASEAGLECVFVSSADIDGADTISVIKQKVGSCYGLAAIASERRLLIDAVSKNNADIPGASSTRIASIKETTPYIQIETAIALAYDLPVLVLKENGILEEGVLEPYCTEIPVPDFDIDDESYFSSPTFSDAVNIFRDRVRSVYNKKCVCAGN